MAFGQKSGSLRNLKKTLAKGGGKGFIKFIPKNGSMNVRFIQEPEEWVNYAEHYDEVAKASFPCTMENDCPGCRSDSRKSYRYLCNVVDRDDKDRVIALQLPKDLANRLVIKYEKWGTITDRDIELSRSGEKLDTVYDLDASQPDRKNISGFQPQDLEKVLEEAFNKVFGEDDEEDEPVVEVRTRKKSAASTVAKRTSKAAAVDEDSDEDTEEDEEPEEEVKPAKKAAKKATKKAAPPEPEFEEDDEDEDEPEEDEPDEDEEDGEGYDEETLLALPLGALRAVARDFGVDPRGKAKADIVAEIMEAGDEVGEDPPF